MTAVDSLRREVKAKTFEKRKRYNSTIRGQGPRKDIGDANKADLVAKAVEGIAEFLRHGKHKVGASGTSIFDADGRDAEIALIWTKGLLSFLSRIKN